jgi:5-methylthioadenosine/S-adenosylhomocysteine deaminase
MQAEAILIRNAAWVLSAGPGPTDILIEAGRIVAIGSDLAAPPAAQVIDGRDRLVTPGLVNAHWHSPMQLSAGTSDRTNHKVFMWENQVDTANRSKEEIYLSAVVGCLQMLKSGTTSVIDHFPEQGFGLDDVATVVKAFEDCGMRAVVALRIFDGEYSDIVPPPERVTPELRAALAAGNTLKPRPMQESLDLVREAIGRFDRTVGRIRVFPAPSNPVRCSDEMLVACQELAERLDTGVHCHLLETRTQAELAARAYGRSMVEHMEAIGAFSGRWSCAHCNWLSAAEIAIMGRLGAVAVFNPESNLKIGSGIPPIPALLAAGVPCAVGTDGASTNDNLILQDAMQLVAILHRAGEPDRRRWVTVDDAIAMATTGGAQAMREPELGRLAPGAKADLVLYDLSAAWWVPLNDPTQQWVFGERGGSVDTVIIDGRVVVENGSVVTIDEDAVLNAARTVLPGVRSRNSAVREIAEAVAALE